MPSKMKIPEEMYTFDGRLSSFSVSHSVSRRRTSAAKTKAQNTVSWSLEAPSTTQLAKAGFYYCPTPSSSDNVYCFLCHKALDGWEAEDDPVAEHIHHSADCAWAILMSIEQRTDASKAEDEDPLSDRLMEARRATFADRWPHDGKRGWSCKTEKMVEAGWYYCPTLESDDFVSCSYCGLSLDGWEPKDKPMDEHRRRSPKCSFFSLISRTVSNATGRGTKKGRGSTASRMSTQSNVTVLESASTDIADAEEGDSFLTNVTTVSNVSVCSKAGKKSSRAKKATTGAKGTRSRTTKTNIIEASSILEAENDSSVVSVDLKSTRVTRGKKRASDDMTSSGVASRDEREGTEDTVIQTQPAAKRRATRTSSRLSRSHTLSQPISNAQLSQLNNVEMTDPEFDVSSIGIAKKGDGCGEAQSSSAKATARKISNASTASKASLRMEMPDDEEIDKALEADLDRPLTDDEIVEETQELGEAPSKRLTRAKPGPNKALASVAPVRKIPRASKASNDSSVDPQLSTASSLSTDVVESQPSRPARTKTIRKKATKVQQIPRTRSPEGIDVDGGASDDSQENTHEDESLTVLPSTNNARQKRDSQQEHSHQPQARLPRSSAVLNDGELPMSPHEHDSGHEINSGKVHKPSTRGKEQKVKGAEARKGRNSKERTKSSPTMLATVVNVEKNGRLELQEPSKRLEQSKDAKIPKNPHLVKGKRPSSAESVPVERLEDAGNAHESASQESRAAVPNGQIQYKEDLPNAEQKSVPSHPAKAQPNKKPAKSKKVPNIASKEKKEVPSRAQASFTKETTPSPSPQSSDAENHPPSSRPTVLSQLNSQQASRVPLSASTPTASPSRRNMTTNNALSTSLPWTAVDLEAAFFHSPKSRINEDKENSKVDLLNDAIQGVKGMLTSPEKKMTVEQWIQYNAQLTNERMKTECERLVGVFEREGNRALQTLDGLDVSE
ncbi:MAG: hypothetical protein M1837_002194 [Sclerophora amabilis]|nr:MAG: hypothetical protein M1837_002194 [Sclerophora amabilis]